MNTTEINGFEIDNFNQCIECEDILPLDNFDKGRNQCKKCRYDKLKDEFFSVYYLPEEHYVGMTGWLTDRIKTHRLRGKNVEGWKLMASFPTNIEARNYEAMLQSSMGFNGLKYN